MAQSIIDRAIGIVKLDDATYESIEHDQSATTQAAVVVGIAAVAGGIGALGMGSAASSLAFCSASSAGS